MIHALDHVVIAVGDLDAASASYVRIFGRRPSWRGEHPGLGTANTLFRLDNTYVELLAPAADAGFGAQLRARIDRDGEGPFALAFATDDADACAKALRERGLAARDPVDGQGCDAATGAERRWRNVMIPPEDTRGVFLFCIEHRSPADALPPAVPDAVPPESLVHGLDHAVVTTTDADATKAVYGDALGLRLALDKSFEQYGSRLLFFRTGGITVEIAARLGADADPHKPDAFWGLAYRVPDVLATQKRLQREGVDVSEVRKGRKPGTAVCTVRAPTHGVATLLIGPGGAEV